jgi:hypothetical protein
LANDLARNFIVTTPLPANTDERRVLKLSYEEPPIIARARSRLGIGAMARAFKTSVASSKAPDAPCLIEVKAQVTHKGETTPLSKLRVHLARLADNPEGLAQYTATTNAHGVCSIQVERGDYEVRDEPPLGVLPTTSLDDRNISIDEPRQVSLSYITASTAVADEDVVSRVSRSRQLMRALSLRPKTVEILAPSIGQARSYHLELVLPYGLKATDARLNSLDPAALEGARSDEPLDRQSSTSRRVHLHAAGIDQAMTGLAEVALRPHTSMILRGATFVSGLSLLMLILLLFRFDPVGPPQLGALVGLVLAVPGGLAAYVARAQVDRFTSEVLIGLRAVALSSTLWVLLAGATVVVSRRVDATASPMKVGDELWWTMPALYTIVGLNALCVCLLARATWLSARPPEARRRA